MPATSQLSEGMVLLIPGPVREIMAYQPTDWHKDSSGSYAWNTAHTTDLVQLAWFTTPVSFIYLFNLLLHPLPPPPRHFLPLYILRHPSHLQFARNQLNAIRICKRQHQTQSSQTATEARGWYFELDLKQFLILLDLHIVDKVCNYGPVSVIIP